MNRRTAGGAVVLAAAGLVLGGLFLNRPSPPPEAEGLRWLDGFVDRLSAPSTWAARGPAAAALFPGLRPASGEGCVLTWSGTADADPVVTRQSLDLGRLSPDEPCDAAQFGMLSTTFRASEGINPGALAERITARFGPPDIRRDPALRGTITYDWLAQDGILAHLEEPVRPGGADTFSLLFTRSYGAPTAVAEPAEGERWMDRTVALLAGPALVNARGAAAVKLIDADLRPEAGGTETCPTSFGDDRRDKGPIVSSYFLLLDRPDGACADARFDSLSMRIWQREPVTAAAVATRFGARLGPAVVSRDFDRNKVSYRWSTPPGLVVELWEDVSAEGRHWLLLRASRP